MRWGSERLSPLCAVLLTLWVGALAPGCGPAPGGCFEHHVRQAMDLNKARLPVYSEATAGRSEAVTMTLIRAERAALIAARLYDHEALSLEKAGVPVLCELMVDMKHTPPVQAGPGERPGYAPPSPPDPELLRRELRAELDRGFDAVAAAANRKIERLERHPHYSCMARHLLESVRRAATNAPRHMRLAAERGVEPGRVERLARRVIALHLGSFGAADRLDRMAAPLQREGVNIVCGDVPPIPATPSGPGR